MLTPEEQEELQESVALLSDEEVSSAMEELAVRELHLLESPSFSEGEPRRRTIRYAAALSAAAERLSVTQGRTERQVSGTSPDPPEDPSPQGL